MREFKGTYYPYADLYAGNRHFLNLIDEKLSGPVVYYSCISVIVFSAFCLEGYMNHIGPNYFSTWYDEKTGENRKRPKEKLDLICEKIKYVPAFGHRPFQSFMPIFQFRNLLAHNKTEILKGNFEGDYPDIDTKIQKLATPQYAHRFHNDTVKMIRIIHEAHRPNDDPLLSIGDAEWIG
ncbi:MAG: hypothetical protein JW757_01310 [Anaerolineales bacterium]|nr:hypothetical protein [Anaerolineales bacterium]